MWTPKNASSASQLCNAATGAAVAAPGGAGIVNAGEDYDYIAEVNQADTSSAFEFFVMDEEQYQAKEGPARAALDSGAGYLLRTPTTKPSPNRRKANFAIPQAWVGKSIRVGIVQTGTEDGYGGEVLYTVE